MIQRQIAGFYIQVFSVFLFVYGFFRITLAKMLRKSESGENAPLLSQGSSGGHVRFYTTDDVISDNIGASDDEDEGRTRRPSCRSWVSGVDSDAEYLSNASRSSRTLPNNASPPFVYLGLCCAIIAGLCFTSR